MGLGLGGGVAPPRLDVLGRDEVVGSRVPGALPGELEEERLPVGELDDGALRGGETSFRERFQFSVENA